MKYTARKGDKHMNRLIYEYFTSTSSYSGSHSKVKKHQLKISRYNISKYAILNGKYNGRKMSYDTKGFYSSICKMAIKKKNGYFSISEDYANAETSYKIAISFAMGMLAARIIANNKYKISRLYHFTDSRLNTRLKRGEMAPDWFGLDNKGNAYLFESKGTISNRISSDTVDHAKNQLRNVKSVTVISTGIKYNYTEIQKHVIGSCFSKYDKVDDVWHIHDVDPEEDSGMEFTINIDKECFKYYQTFILSMELLNIPYQRVNIGNQYYYCWTDVNEKYYIFGKIYDLIKSGNFNENNSYSNLNNSVDELLEKIELPAHIVADDISTYEDGIIVSGLDAFANA